MAKVAGDELLTRYVVGFEVAGLLLTAALVGAIAVAHREEEDPAAPGGRRAAAQKPGAPMPADGPAAGRRSRSRHGRILTPRRLVAGSLHRTMTHAISYRVFRVK